jgi:hypothetical protein
MFFYTSLFVASVLVALVILYLFNALRDAGKAVYKAFLPSSKNNLSARSPDEALSTTVNETLTPWGWSNEASQTKTARTNRALSSKQTPWGWKGNDRVIREHGAKSTANSSAGIGLDDFFAKNENESNSTENPAATVGWPYREEKFEFAGKSYKVTRKAKPAKTNLRNTGKPWGW